MKKTLLTPVLLALTGLPALAQLPASTTAQNRKVVLEEFTGIYCQYCPDGHKRANTLKDSKPAGDVILVNVHTGGYAQPSGGDPDFRTSEGNAIAAISGMNITGYPTGAVNRHLFAGETGFAVNRGAWAAYADTILAKPSYVNVALEGSLNVATRELTVNAQAYFTGNSTATSNRLTVMLLEDGVSGPQTGASSWYASQIMPDGKYNHNHMLRKVLTTTYNGDVLATTTAGTTINKSYTYTVPAQYLNSNGTLLGNLQLVAFVTEGNTEIVTGAYGPLTLTNFPATNDTKLTSSLFADKEVCSQINGKVRIYNGGSTPITSATFKAIVNGGTPTTVTFTGNIPPASQAFITLSPAPLSNPVQVNNMIAAILTVNGNPAPFVDTVTKSAIFATSHTVAADSVTMRFTQDQWGTETTWTIKEEGTSNVVLSGGPYANLNGAGTLVHTSSFKANPNTCYEVIVLDSYGDGINSGSGAGKYEIVSSNGQISYTGNGAFSEVDRSVFKAGAPVGIAGIPAFASSVTLAPNPTATQSNLTLSLTKGTKLSVQVVDMTGRVVNQIAEQNLAAGTHMFTIATDNLAAGVYHVRIATAEGVVTQRLSVVK